ncbi:MAG: A24 family peptidase [Bryobacteraceae bacterium]
MSYLPLILQIVLAVVAILAAVYDYRFRRIPNWLTLSGVLLGLGLNSFLFGWGGLRTAGLGLGLAFLVYFPLYLLRGMGAGDVKLMGAVGSLVGAANWFGIFIISNILGGVIAIILLFGRGRFGKTFRNVGYMLTEMIALRAPYLKREELDVKSPKAVTLPHGVVIGLGSLVFLVAAAIWAPR